MCVSPFDTLVNMKIRTPFMNTFNFVTSSYSQKSKYKKSVFYTIHRNCGAAVSEKCV